ALTETTVPAVNNAAQTRTRRAAATVARQPARLARAAEPNAGQSKLLQRYIDAREHADPQALIEVLHDNVRLPISPATGHWTGREQVADTLRANMNILGRWRMLPITANRQPGAAGYLRRPGDGTFPPVRDLRAPLRAGQAHRRRRLQTTVAVPRIRPNAVY